MFRLQSYDGTLPFIRDQRTKDIIVEEMNVIGVSGRRKCLAVSDTCGY
jgi:hypothetical protein